MPQNGHFAGGTTAAPRRTFGPVTGGRGQDTESRNHRDGHLEGEGS